MGVASTRDVLPFTLSHIAHVGTEEAGNLPNMCAILGPCERFWEGKGHYIQDLQAPYVIVHTVSEAQES